MNTRICSEFMTSPQIGRNDAIKPESRERNNWTMVSAIVWYRSGRWPDLDENPYQSITEWYSEWLNAPRWSIIPNARVMAKGVTHQSREDFVGTSLAAEPLLALAVTVTSEQRVDSVLHGIVQGLASQPGVALARIWLLPSVHLPGSSHAVSDPSDHLCLVARPGNP